MCSSRAELSRRCEVVGQPEDGRALVGLVGADALEDAGAVVQPVRADVDPGVGPVHELAVHPDLLGLAHSATSSGRMVRGLLDDVHRTRAREAEQLGRRQRGHVPLGARADPEDGLGQAAFARRRRVDVLERERRDGARLEAGRLAHLLGAGDPREAAFLRRWRSSRSRRAGRPGRAPAPCGRRSRRRATSRSGRARSRPRRAASFAVGVPSGNSSTRTSARPRAGRR